MTVPKEDRIVFGVTNIDDGSKPTLVLGISAAAWQYMADGKTHTLDLSRIGLPVDIVLFGAATPQAAYAVMEAHNRKLGLAGEDRSGENFAIAEKTEPHS